MAEMKKVYVAKFKHGLLGTCKVFAWDEADAMKAAFATYAYNAGMRHPSPKIEDVVESVELDPEQSMDSVTMQPASQFRCRSVSAPEGNLEKLG